RKCLRSASETAYPLLVSERVCSYRPLPSARRFSLPTSDRRPSPSAPIPGSPVFHLPEIHSSSASLGLPNPPNPKTPDPPPHRSSPKSPPLTVRRPAVPKECARAFAASDHPSPPPPESLRPFAPRP